ncbi:MAG TPA: hypothetical protein PK020_16695 [Ilumatobacteraceae bacterium]|nr:hypothetical protein [Ilumatobacteraceae bacterium]
MSNDAWSPDPELVVKVDVAAAQWRQGDIFADTAIVRYAFGDQPLTEQASRLGSGPGAIREKLPLAVVVSQTCEVVRPCVARPMVHLAAVVQLSSPVLEEALKNWRPQYVAVPWAGDDFFVDLEVQGTVEKSVLLNAAFVSGCPDSGSRLRFAEGLARHRSRFAFPDDMAPTIAPLATRFREKAGKDTPQGRRINELLEIRARAIPDWDADAIAVELFFVVDSARLPPVPPGSEPDPDMLSEIASLEAQRLAELLDDDTIDAVKRNALWQRLADAWGARAKATGSISEVTAQALPTNELTFEAANSMPMLDLDYLSD